ncbi:MAG: hypothetical protein IJ688_14200 [Treponema sp.]|nr:hypothetical protein [Treponema sp.]
MKKIMMLFPALFLLLLTSCWIQPHSDEYEKIGDSYYFYDYDSMKTFLIYQINETFTDWHYGKTKFDQRYKEYINNIDPNEEDLDNIKQNNFSYAVRTGTSNKSVILKNEKKISGKYFWITTKSGNSIVFFRT